MPRKIYDVLPPKVAQQAEKNIKAFIAEGTKKKRKRAYKKEIQFSFKPLLIGGGVVVLFLAVYLFFSLAKVNVQIWPRTEVLSYTQKITIDKTADSVDEETGVLPAQYFEEEKDGSQEFLATGNASNEGKATGTITIYNKSEKLESFTMKIGTHFLSDSGKYFVTLAKIVVPAAKKSGGKVVPGSIEAKVEAAEGGDGYNIGAAKFVVPKLSGTEYYYSIYAESKQAMAGGYEGKTKKVTDDDILAAKDELVKGLTSASESALKGKVPAEKIIVDNAISTSTVSSSSQAKAGTVAEKFTYQAKVKTRALAFNKADMEKFVKDYILDKLPDSQNIIDGTYAMEYTADSVNLDDGKATITVKFSAKAYDAIDKASLAPLFKGKSGPQINEAVTSSLGEKVSKVKVNFWPFWVQKGPKSSKAVKIDLKFD